MSKATVTIVDSLNKFFSLRMNSRIAIKRNYDDWTFKQLWADKKRRSLITVQALNLPKHVKLGPDLAASQFVVDFCDGKVRDQDGQWLDNKKSLPREFSPSFRLTAIKARDCRLMTEGVDNFIGLEHLESLDISGNPRLDDFSCDLLGRIFRKSTTLNNIDLSRNPLISVYGLEILFRIPSLKRIVAIGTRAAKYDDIDLFTLAAQDEKQCDVFVHDDGRQFRLDELESLIRNDHKMDNEPNQIESSK